MNTIKLLKSKTINAVITVTVMCVYQESMFPAYSTQGCVFPAHISQRMRMSHRDNYVSLIL